jgi:hypothetical protein
MAVIVVGIIVCFAYGKRSVRQSGLIFDIAGFFFLDAGVAVWTSGRLMIDTCILVHGCDRCWDYRVFCLWKEKCTSEWTDF